MAFDPRSSRLLGSEYDREYSVKVAKQNLRKKTILSLIVTISLVALLVGIIFISSL